MNYTFVLQQLCWNRYIVLFNKITFCGATFKRPILGIMHFLVLTCKRRTTVSPQILQCHDARAVATLLFKNERKFSRSDCNFFTCCWSAANTMSRYWLRILIHWSNRFHNFKRLTIKSFFNIFAKKITQNIPFMNNGSVLAKTHSTLVLFEATPCGSLCQ